MRISPDGPREIRDAELPQPVLIHHSLRSLSGNDHHNWEQPLRIIKGSKKISKHLFSHNTTSVGALNSIYNSNIIYYSLIVSRIAEEGYTRVLYRMFPFRLSISIAHLQDYFSLT